MGFGAKPRSDIPHGVLPSTALGMHVFALLADRRRGGIRTVF